MIVDLILTILFYALAFVLNNTIGTLSDASLPSEAVNAIMNMRGTLNAIDVVLPVLTIFAVLSAVLVREALLLGYKVAMWIIRRIPTQS